jgi:alcohol dehydrogenase
MRAMSLVEYGRPLQMLEVERPSPPPGYALVQVLTCGVCFSDVKTVRGHMPYSASLALPHVAGHEMCGRVLELNLPPGARSRVVAGDRVVAYHVWGCRDCASCRRGEEQLCTADVAWMGFSHPGVFREYMTVPVEYLLPVPEVIPASVAPVLTCAMGTAYRAVAVRGRVQPGEVAVVIGLGGVGVHGALIAAAAGAHVVGVDRAEKLGAAREAGVPTVVETGQGLLERVREIAPEGVDLVLEATGVPSLMETARQLLRPGGRVVGIGYRVGETMGVTGDQLVLLEQSVIGSRYASRADIEHVIRMVADGVVSPVIDSVLPLQRLNEAIERLESGRVTGRLVLEVSG